MLFSHYFWSKLRIDRESIGFCATQKVFTFCDTSCIRTQRGARIQSEAFIAIFCVAYTGHTNSLCLFFYRHNTVCALTWRFLQCFRPAIILFPSKSLARLWLEDCQRMINIVQCKSNAWCTHGSIFAFLICVVRQQKFAFPSIYPPRERRDCRKRRKVHQRRIHRRHWEHVYYFVCQYTLCVAIVSTERKSKECINKERTARRTSVEMKRKEENWNRKGGDSAVAISN